jgi:hypothetical protein
MKSNVSAYVLLMTLTGTLVYLPVASSQIWEGKVKTDFKIQKASQPHNQGQTGISEGLKIAGLKENEETEVKLFLEVIQKSVRKNDVFALSKIVRYPITLKTPQGKNIKVLNPKEFVANYPRVISANWNKAVLRQTYEKLFENWQGIMIGRGEIWFSGICIDNACVKRELKIIAINPWFADWD